MSDLLTFYRGAGLDSEGRRLADIWAWDDDEWEAVHDFIQWLFPLPEPSRFNPDAPLLTEDLIGVFHHQERLRLHLQKSFERFVIFLGLARTPEGSIVEGPNFAERVPDVWACPNHNWLRISRVLRSLSLLGLGCEARTLYRKLQEFHRSLRFPIDDEAFRYWTEAAGSEPRTQ